MANQPRPGNERHAEGRDCADAEQRIEWLTDVLASTDKWAKELRDQRDAALVEVDRLTGVLESTRADRDMFAALAKADRG